MSYTDIVVAGDRLLVDAPDSHNQRTIHTYQVITPDTAVRISTGKMFKIVRKDSGAVYINRSPVVARA